MDSKEIKNRIRHAGVSCNHRFNKWLLSLGKLSPLFNNLKWWLILTFPSKWSSRYISYLHERPPFNDCLFDYDEVYVSPCSLKELNILWMVDAGLVEMKPPDFGGYSIKTGREYVPYIAWLGISILKNDPRDK